MDSFKHHYHNQNKIHHDEYNYSAVEYKSFDKKIKLKWIKTWNTFSFTERN